jgi:hypothetical protein
MAEWKQKPDDNIVPIAVGNPAKAASLAIDRSHLDEYFADKEAVSSVVAWERPPNFGFWRLKTATHTS